MSFRILDTLDNKYICPGPAGQRYSIDSMGNLYDPAGNLCDKYKIVQFFSGVRDKNGVNIYDGDIVEYQGRESVERNYVVYSKEEFCWGLLSMDGQNLYPLAGYLDYTVVTPQQL